MQDSTSKPPAALAASPANQDGLGADLLKAATEGWSETVRSLIAKNPSQGDVARALILAADQGRLAIVQMLLPVIDSARGHSFEGDTIIVFLFKEQANLPALAKASFLNPEDHRSSLKSALQQASNKGHVEVIKLLLTALSPEDVVASDALDFAIANRRTDVIALLAPLFVSDQEALMVSLKAAAQQGMLEGAQRIASLLHPDHLKAFITGGPHGISQDVGSAIQAVADESDLRRSMPAAHTTPARPKMRLG